MGATEIQKELEHSVRKFCHHCICKTCLIAEVNGGAPGCGDCYKCSNEGYNLFCQSCLDYYNRDSAKGMTLDYLHRKKIENKKIKSEEKWLLSEEELEKFIEELTKSVKDFFGEQ